MNNVSRTVKQSLHLVGPNSLQALDKTVLVVMTMHWIRSKLNHIYLIYVLDKHLLHQALPTGGLKPREWFWAVYISRWMFWFKGLEYVGSTKCWSIHPPPDLALFLMYNYLGYVGTLVQAYRTEPLNVSRQAETISWIRCVWSHMLSAILQRTPPGLNALAAVSKNGFSTSSWAGPESWKTNLIKILLFS